MNSEKLRSIKITHRFERYRTCKHNIGGRPPNLHVKQHEKWVNDVDFNLKLPESLLALR